jgi:hypothetical protein
MALWIIQVAKHDGLGWTGLLAGRLDLAIGHGVS